MLRFRMGPARTRSLCVTRVSPVMQLVIAATFQARRRGGVVFLILCAAGNESRDPARSTP